MRALLFLLCALHSVAATEHTFTAYTSDLEYADSNGQVGVSFFVNGAWTPTQELVTGPEINVPYSITVDLEAHPTQLHFSFMDGSSNAWGFWKVTLDCWTLIQNPGGSTGSPYPEGSQPPNYWWIDTGDSHAFETVTLNIPPADAPCWSEWTHYDFKICTADKTWTVASGDTKDAGGSTNPPAGWLKVSFEVDSVWMAPQPVIDSGMQNGQCATGAALLPGWPSSMTLHVADPDTWCPWKIDVGCSNVWTSPYGEEGEPYPVDAAGNALPIAEWPVDSTWTSAPDGQSGENIRDTFTLTGLSGMTQCSPPPSPPGPPPLPNPYCINKEADGSGGETFSQDLCPPNAPLYGFLGAALALLFSCFGSAYGTGKAGAGISAIGVESPGLVMKAIIPVVMAGVLGIYGLIIAVIIGNSIKKYEVVPAADAPDGMVILNGYSAFNGFAHLASGLACGLACMAAGIAIGIVGDAGVRAFALNGKLYVGMVLILIFAEALGLYGLIIGLILSSHHGGCTVHCDTQITGSAPFLHQEPAYYEQGWAPFSG